MRWGSGHWGIDQWGGEGVDRKLSYALEIDWDRDGTFDGVNEAGYMTSWSVKRGRRQLLKSDHRGFEPPMVGELEIHLLDDTDRRFDAYNPSSPLYGLLNPGAALQFRVVDEATGIAYYLFKGTVTDIRPVAGKIHSVTLRAEDGIKSLSVEVRTALQEDITLSAAISKILEESGWTGPTLIDGVTDILPYWWATGKPALSEIMDLVDSSLGTFFVTADGEAVYKNRNNTGVSGITIVDADIMEDFGIQIPAPQDVVRNAITVNVRPRVIETLVELWQLQDKPVINAGETKSDIWAPYTYSGMAIPALNVTCSPVTDFTVNTKEDGTGTDLTSQCSVTKSDFANTSKLSIKNNSGSNGYITLLKLRGDAVSTALIPTAVIKEDAASIEQLGGAYPFTLDTNWLQDTNWGLSLAQYFLSLLSATGRYFPQVKLKDNPAKQFEIELFDRVQINSAREGLDAILRVGYIEHKSAIKNCDIVETTLYFEPNIGVSAGNQWFFTAIFGTTTNFTL